MVDAYTRYYRQLRCFTWVSLSAIDVAKFEAAEPAITDWIGAMRTGLAANRQNYRTNLDRTIYGWECYHVDFASLCEHLAADPAITDTDLKTKSAALATALRASVIKVWSGSYADEFSGLALWWGEAGDWRYYRSDYHAQPTFAADTGWYAFLNAWNTGAVPPWPKSTAAVRTDWSAASRPFSKREVARVAARRGAVARAWPDPHIDRAKYGLTDVTFVDANHGWAVGYDNITNNAIILRTTDGGVHWKNRSTASWWAYQFGAVKALDTQKAWVAGSEGWPDSIILRTTDGGKTWPDQASGTLQYLNTIDFTDASTGWIAGTDATLLRTTDGGKHWVEMPTWDGAGDLWSVDFVDATNGWIAGGDEATQTGFVRRTTDGGATWQEQAWSTGSGMYSVVAPASPGATGYAVGGDPLAGRGVILRSTDGGANWQGTIASPPAHWLCDVTAPTADAAWIVGEKGKVMKTTDAGDSWDDASIATVTDDLTASSFTTANDGWIVGDCEEIFHTTDGGANWTSVIADVTRPVVSAWNASARTGKWAVLKYKVTDDMSATADVRVKVMDSRGHVLANYHVGAVQTGYRTGLLFRCRVSPGTYSFKVYATDESGNPQRRVAKAKLVVKP
jgi:photosystem II stability/assembly factor-like uncharacterized protein